MGTLTRTIEKRLGRAFASALLIILTGAAAFADTPWFAHVGGASVDRWEHPLDPFEPVEVTEPERLPDLPERVDNSARAEFPPVRSQDGNSCSQEAALGNILSYELNVLRERKYQGDADRVPAWWSWNFLNNATDNGTEFCHGFEIAHMIGAPNAELYLKAGITKPGQWPSGYEVWYDAARNRVSNWRVDEVTTLEDLEMVKRWLFNRGTGDKKQPGGLWAFDTRLQGIELKTIPDDQQGQGKHIWTEWSKHGTGHLTTITGYDDAIGYDVNGDGKVTNELDIDGDGLVTLADHERGAFIVVNSWGDHWADDGKVYVLYRVLAATDWPRAAWLGRIKAADYQPNAMLRLKFSFGDRSELRMKIGIAGDGDPKIWIEPEPFNGMQSLGGRVGQVPMRGPDDKQPIEVGVDISRLLDSIPDTKKPRIMLEISGADQSESRGRFEEAELILYTSKGKQIYDQTFDFNPAEFDNAGLRLELEVPVRRLKRAR